jgi:hypothetical protein
VLGLLYWAIQMWQAGSATAGQVVLVCTLGITTLEVEQRAAARLHLGADGLVEASELALVGREGPHQRAYW